MRLGSILRRAADIARATDARATKSAPVFSAKTATELSAIRNVGIVAHVDHGKTTLTERILYLTGMVKHIGDVDDGNTITDFMPQEQERGITIQSAAVSFPWRAHRVNLIDTPGHVDFTVEVERSLRVLDGAVVVIDAVAGVQAQTECVWRQTDRHRVPRVVFVNKMDREGASFQRAAGTIQSRLKARPLLTQMSLGDGANFSGVIDLLDMKQLTWRDKTGATVTTENITTEYESRAEEARHHLIEQLAECDDVIMESYLEGKMDIPSDVLRKALRRSTIGMKGIPVMCGAAFRNKAVQPVLDAMVDYLPSPLDMPPPLALSKSGAEISVLPKADGPLAALAFKVVHDKHRGPLVYFRVYSGSFPTKTVTLNSTRNASERPNQLLHVFANMTEELQNVTVGNIGAAVGLKLTKTGDTLISPSDKNPIVLKGVQIPPPVFFCAIEADSPAAQPALDAALEALTREDPSLTVSVSQETGQTLLSGMGELHLDVIGKRLLSEFKVEAKMGKMCIGYRESVSAPVKVTHKVDEMNGATRLQAALTIEIKPVDGDNVIISEKLANQSWLESLPQQQRLEVAHSIEEGCKMGLSRGAIMSYPTQGLSVTVTGGVVYDPLSSTPAAYRKCAMMTVAEALKQSPCLLEPLMDVEYMGKVLGDLSSSRRATILDVDTTSPEKILRAHVPLREMVGYSTYLRSLTHGEASYSLAFVKYGQLSQDAQNTLMKEMGMDWMVNK